MELEGIFSSTNQHLLINVQSASQMPYCTVQKPLKNRDLSILVIDHFHPMGTKFGVMFQYQK